MHPQRVFVFVAANDAHREGVRRPRNLCDCTPKQRLRFANLFTFLVRMSLGVKVAVFLASRKPAQLRLPSFQRRTDLPSDVPVGTWPLLSPTHSPTPVQKAHGRGSGMVVVPPDGLAK